jgi:hypothetical protein
LDHRDFNGAGNQDRVMGWTPGQVRAVSLQGVAIMAFNRKTTTGGMRSSKSSWFGRQSENGGLRLMMNAVRPFSLRLFQSPRIEFENAADGQRRIAPSNIFNTLEICEFCFFLLILIAFTPCSRR